MSRSNIFYLGVCWTVFIFFFGGGTHLYIFVA